MYFLKNFLHLRDSRDMESVKEKDKKAKVSIFEKFDPKVTDIEIKCRHISKLLLLASIIYVIPAVSYGTITYKINLFI